MSNSKNSSTRRQQNETELANALRDLWEWAHGASIGSAKVLVGTDNVVAWLKGVFSPAERASTSQADGHQLIQQYTEKLLAVIKPDLQSRIEAITGRRVLSSHVQTDLKADYLHCLFILGERFGGPSNETNPGIHSEEDMVI